MTLTGASTVRWFTFLLLSPLFVAAGCSSTGVDIAAAGPDHPASPQAAESPLPPQSHTLSSPDVPTTPSIEAADAPATAPGHGQHHPGGRQ